MRLADETGRASAAGVLCILVAAACALAQVDLSNAVLYPLFDGVLPVARDVNVGTGVLANALIVLAAARRPSVLREGALAAGALACALAGSAAMAAALASGSAALLCAGAVMRGLGSSWIGLVCLVARCALGTRALLAGIPLAYGAAQLASWALVQAPTQAALLVQACCPLVTLPLARPFAAQVVRATAQAPAQEDARLLHPASYIPLASRFYACIFVCTTAMGVNLRLGPAEGTPGAVLPCLAVFGALAVLGLVRADARRYDTLFSVGVVVLLAGFLVAPVEGLRPLTQCLIAMGGAFLNVLFALVLASAAGRNRLAAVSVFAWSGVVSSLGSILGANVGALVAHAPSDAAHLATAGVAVLVLAYVLLGLRGFSFAETIEGIRPPEPVRLTCGAREELRERACAELAQVRGLTPREAEVLALLARGRNNAFIQEELTLTRNTVKTYIKRVYAKLGVHGQQEVIDLVEGALAGE